MSARIKRKLENDGNLEQQQEVSSGSTQQRSKRVGKKVDAINEVNYEFRKAMLTEKQSRLEHLNLETQRIVAETELTDENYAGPHPVHAFPEVCGDYLRQATDIEKLYECAGAEGDVVGFGSDDVNALGVPVKDNELRNTAYKPTPLQLRNRGVRMVAAGGMHSVALTSRGEVYSWGNSDDGTLGRDSTADNEMLPVPVTGFVTRDGVKEDGMIHYAVAGDSFSLFQSIAGNVYFCGKYNDSDSGKFSHPDRPGGPVLFHKDKPVHIFELGQPVERLAAGENFAAAVLQDGTLVTWGFGTTGELARSADMTRPTSTGEFDLGKKFYYVGDKPNADIVRDKFLKPAPVRWPLGMKKSVLSIACGGHHLVVAARESHSYDSNMYTSGLNQYGQLGHGDTVSRHELTLVEALKGKNIAKVAAGEMHTHGVTVDAALLYSFGRADYGQLGIGGPFPPGEFRSTPVITQFEAKKRVIIKDVVAKDRNTFALSIDNELYTWGFNEVRNTGHKTDDDSDVYRPRKLDLQPFLGHAASVLRMSVGGQHGLLVVKRHS